jgi:hypothetical protein
MSTDNDFSTNDENSEEVGQGVTNTPRGNGELDDDAQQTGEDKLEQAGGGH